jgi:hypothetical protein
MIRLEILALCILLLLTGTSNMVSYGFFLVNQNSIISNYCINKYNPKKKCNGKCFLKTKILTQSTADQTNVLSFSISEFSQWYQNDLCIITPVKWVFWNILTDYFTIHKTKSFPNSLDHPPD